MSKITWKRVAAVFLGNLILGIGVALLRFSQMGNDPFCAANMALSDGLGMGLGTFQLLVNLVLLVLQALLGRKYLGLGSLVNLLGLGYITQYTGIVLEAIAGDNFHINMVQELLIMLIALLVVTFGLAMYQAANLGVAPYDYLALGMTDHFPVPYFANRMTTDCICVVIILAAVLTGFVGWGNSHLGVGTILTAFCLGPLVDAFSGFHARWIDGK